MNVEEVLNKHKISFIPSGRDFLIKCLNPDHQDSNPSLRVDRVTGVFHCFACSFKGNIFNRFGVEQSQLSVARNKLKKKLEKLTMERVGLQIPEDALYFEDDYRNISSETYKHFKAFTYEDDFPNRLVFPIYDITGKINNFCTRSFDPMEKRNRYRFYPPSASTPLFPMNAKPKYSMIILVEGMFDLLNLFDKGITNVMTAFGTQTVTEDKLDLLRMLGVHEIHLLFDGDEPGQKAAEKVKSLAESRGFLVVNTDLRDFYGEGVDPGSLTAKQIKKLKDTIWPEYWS